MRKRGKKRALSEEDEINIVKIPGKEPTPAAVRRAVAKMRINTEYIKGSSVAKASNTLHAKQWNEDSEEYEWDKSSTKQEQLQDLLDNLVNQNQTIRECAVAFGIQVILWVDMPQQLDVDPILSWWETVANRLTTGIGGVS